MFIQRFYIVDSPGQEIQYAVAEAESRSEETSLARGCGGGAGRPWRPSRIFPVFLKWALERY